MDQKVALDQPTLKALAAETRVKILKLLDAQQRTQSDLARELRMSLPTIGEHLKSLENAGLVEREQTERKWKYYSVTPKARMLLHPHTTTIWVVLGVFIVSAAGTVLNAIDWPTPPVVSEARIAVQAEALTLAAEAPVQAFPVWLAVFGIATVAFLILLIVLLHGHGWLGKRLTKQKNI